MTAVVSSRRKQIMHLLTVRDPSTPMVQRLRQLAAALFGVSGAGMFLVGQHSHHIVVHGTTVLPGQLEDRQLAAGHGPCMQAVRALSPVLVPDLLTHQTLSWPVFAEQAGPGGCGRCSRSRWRRA